MKKGTAKPAPSNDKDKKGGAKDTKDVKGKDNKSNTSSSSADVKGKDKKGKDATPVPITPAVPEKPRWTGKTPVQYLNEYCQKNHMDKPIYQDIKSFQPNTFRCRITLAFEGKKKTKTTKDYASSLSMPTVQDAKTYSALVALHDLCGNTTIYKLFAPEYTPYWMVLQEEAKKDAEKQKVEQAEEAEQQRIYEEEKAAAPQHTQIIPPIHMSEEAMHTVHSLVMQLGLKNNNTEKIDKKQLDDKEKEIMTASLVELGFQVDDIQEALLQTQNYTDVNDIIGWLCLHVPNNQLPLHFKPKSIGLDKKRSQQQELSQSSTLQHIKDPLYINSFNEFSNIGFTRDQINRSINSLLETGYKATTQNADDTFYRLYYSLWNINSEQQQLQDTKEDIENEKMALEAIYQDNSQFTFVSDRHYRYRVENETLVYLELDIIFPVWSKYPYQLPVFKVKSANSTPILNHLLIKHLNQDLSALMGTPMVFSIISYLDSNLNTIIEMKQEIPSVSPSLESTLAGDNDDDTIISSTTSNIKQLSLDNKTPGNNNKKKHSGYRPLGRADLERLDKELKGEYCKLHSGTDSAVEAKRKMLPVFKKKTEFLEAMNKNQVLVITAETGCGKSTQIPQYILESFVKDGNGSKCNIVCTQPRRISAIGVAERVSFEWSGGDDRAIGKTIGYQIRNESKRSRDTRLLFCTTGILLRRILDIDSISDVSHIIIDEVHERSTDNDFLLIILREIIAKRKDLKIILMSATLNATQISKYFGCDDKSIFSIPGFTYPVQNYHLDDCFNDLKQYLPVQPKNTTSTSTSAVEQSLETKLASFNIGFDQKRVNADIVEALVLHLVEDKVGQDKSILVFVPGLADILDLCYRLSHPVNNTTSFITDKIWCVPLHSSLSPKDQQKVFHKAPRGKTKVVISTNIAETSITIEDVEIVVDCGRVNQMVYDSISRNSVMSETWTSKASCRQRAGRAGRTSHGLCYKVFSRDTETKLDAQDTPEILRSSLQQLCLHVCLFLSNMKASNLSIQGFLSRAIEPPSSQQIESSINELISINALDTDQKLTPLGYHLANLPVDVYIGKMLLFGCIFRCIDPILTIAAVLSSKSPFLNPPDKKLRPQQAFSIHQSDHLSLVNVYNQWKQSIASGTENSFIKDNFLSLPVLQTIQDLKFQFIETLSEIGFLPPGITSTKLVKEQKSNKGSDCVDQVCGYIYNSNSDKTKILTGVICAGMYPKIARIDYPSATYHQTASGAVRKKFQADDLLIQTNTDNKLSPAFVHPRSVNYKEGEYTYPFLIYHDRVLTSRLFLHNVSNITPLTLLLFSIGGDIELNKSNFQEITLDKWLKFKPSSGKIAILFNEIRILFNHLLKQKIDNPNYSTHSSIIIDIITKLVMSEGYL